MKRFGQDETYPLVLMSRDGGPIHGIVKNLAGKHGFLWRGLSDFPLPRNAAIVLVAPAGDEKMFSVLSSKCGVWNENENALPWGQTPWKSQDGTDGCRRIRLPSAGGWGHCLPDMQP